MIRFKLLQSTPLKLTLLFTGLLLATFLVTGLSVYEIMRWELFEHHDKAISELYASIAGNKGDDDTDFLDTVEANIRAAHGHDRVILARRADGTVLAGNIPPLMLPNGWSTMSADKIGLHGHRQYRLLAGTVRGNRLIVGQSYQDIDELRTIAAVGFGWTSIIVVVMAFFSGSVIGRRAQRRFRAVQETMDGISRGELSARLPLLGNGDDIDQLSAHINRALQQLETTVEGMRQVSADIAHDLKTPLNRLRINIEEARRGTGRKATKERALDAAAAEIRQVNETFDALLRISQLETGARKKRFKHLDLHGILLETFDLYDGTLEQAQCDLVAALDSANATIDGDRELLMQMWCNLIDNALRHCPVGTRIKISTALVGNELNVAVEDDGPGIPAEEREKVFRRLYRLEQSRSTPGTGLGLSLVKAIADLHDAPIHLEDAGPGLRAVLRFPLVQPAQRTAPSGRLEGASAGGWDSVGKPVQEADL